MKRIKYILIFLVMFSITINAQDQRTLNTKVADVMALMPTEDLQLRNKLMKEVVDNGKPFMDKVAEMLVPPGTGDDVAARYVINGLSRYANDFKNEKARVLCENSLLDALNKKDNKDIKRFILTQLYLVASDKSIDNIEKYILDDALTDASVAVLVGLNTEKSKQTLLNALKKAEGRSKVVLVKAMGVTKYKPANDVILKMINTNDVSLKKEIFASLSKIASQSSFNILFENVKKVNFGYNATNVTDAFITYIENLAANGNLKLAQKAINIVLKNCSSNELLHNNAAAVKIYYKYFSEKALSYILKNINNPNKDYRNAILSVIKNSLSDSNTKKFIDKTKSLSADAKADVIYMLSVKGKKTIVEPFLKSSLNSKDAQVREATLTALATMGKSDVLSVIVNHMSQGKDVEYSKNIILYLCDNKHLNIVAEVLPKANNNAIYALVDVIGEKRGKQYFKEIVNYTKSDNDKIKTSALKALKNVVAQENTETLLSLLFKSSKKEEVCIQNAIFEAVNNGDNKKQNVTELIALLDVPAKAKKIIPVLPKFGCKKALDKIYALYKSGDSDMKNIAFNALVNWKDYEATKYLFEICDVKGDYHTKAFDGFINQVVKSNIPNDQKLLLFRKIMTKAENNNEKIKVIKKLADVPTFLSFVYTSKFLNNLELQQASCFSLMKIALPQGGSKVGLQGDIIKNTLAKVEKLISGPESSYYKININKYINSMPDTKGYVSIFNGKNLDGWKGLVGNPVSRQKMTPKELKANQIKANKKMHDNWSVKNGEIVFSGKGNNICTVKDYENFEMIVDWRISKKGDSGIYLRGTPQVQIWDISRVDVGAQVGSGGLYNNKNNISKPLVVADNPIDDWNTFRIKMENSKVTVYLNGILVVDNVTFENYWEPGKPIYPVGPIELQAHGTNLAFRDIYVREINDKEYSLSEEEKAEGFVSLFNGKNLDGWVGNKTDYLVEDNVIVIRPKQGGHGNLYTEKEYKDFIYKFDFKLTPAANNGLGIRTPLEGDAAYVGMELQILDNPAPVYANLKKYQYHGSVYGVIPAKRGYLKPVGEWNHEEVIVKGSHVKVILNGTVIVDGDIKEASKNGTMDHKNHPGLKREKGHIGFLGHGSVVFFKNIKIKEL